MSIGFISHRECLLHNMGDFHPEQPARLVSIKEAVIHSDLSSVITYYDAPLAKRKHLLQVHDKDYIDYIFQMAPAEGLIPLDPDVWMNPHSLKSALRAAGAAVYAAELLMEKKENIVFCNIRPPGHHAEKDKAMGFCIFNNIAIAAAHLLQNFALNRVAIIDFDVHHGNGTENIFKDDDRVLYCSSFQHPFYPFAGADTRNNHIINIPLTANTSSDIYRDLVEKFWFKQIEKFAPDIILVSAGFDAYYQDEMANLLLTANDYFWLSQNIKIIADHVCEGRILSVLEGGYHLKGLGECVVAHLKGLHGDMK
jgi:acetoin utilization deacetylase AcuC-like enzyme